MVYATKDFCYCGDNLERGQVVELRGALNDDALLEHRLFIEVSPGDELVSCAKCQKTFVSQSALRVHSHNSHSTPRIGI